MSEFSAQSRLCNRTSLFADFPRSPLSVGSVIMNRRGVCAVVLNVFGIASSDPLRDRSFRTLLIIFPARRYRRSRGVRIRRSGYKTRPPPSPIGSPGVSPAARSPPDLLRGNIVMTSSRRRRRLAIVPKQMSLHCPFAVA